jgi:hypothetical protein
MHGSSTKSDLDLVHRIRRYYRPHHAAIGILNMKHDSRLVQQPDATEGTSMHGHLCAVQRVASSLPRAVADVARSRDQTLQDLSNQYSQVLGRLRRSDFPDMDDRYSGVFLPFAFDEYRTADFRVMHVGRETSGWNTETGKNTLARIFTANETRTTADIVKEAESRYRQHLDIKPDGTVKTTSRSRFKQYFFRLARELALPPKSIIYANLFAWDYAGRSPLERPADELTAISAVSLELLALQIKFFEPHAIVFSTGYAGIDGMIKTLFNQHFAGHRTVMAKRHKLWEFEVNDMACFRIAHPRAAQGHGEYRTEVINRLKEIRSGRTHSQSRTYLDINPEKDLAKS